MRRLLVLVVAALAACGGGNGKSYPNWDAMTKWENATHGGNDLSRSFMEKNYSSMTKQCGNSDRAVTATRMVLAGLTDPAIQGDVTMEDVDKAVHEQIGLFYFVCGPSFAEAITKGLFDGSEELRYLAWMRTELPTYED